MTGEKQQLLCPFLSLSERQRKNIEEKGREAKRSREKSPRKELKKEMSHLTREMIYGGGRGCVGDAMM